MSTLELGAHDTLYYEYQPPARDAHHTFVFFNALTSGDGAWNAERVPALRQQGYGTLAYNLRGQDNSSFGDPRSLDCDHIVDDAMRLLSEVNPVKPILVGLSISGLFAAHAMVRGARANGLALISTLRRNGLRLRWSNYALVHCAEFGGLWGCSLTCSVYCCSTSVGRLKTGPSFWCRIVTTR